MNQKEKYTDYPNTDSDAEKRYNMWKNEDPYPKIGAALLNSADIKAYVKTTGMIYPFDENELQGASYKVKIGGKVIYWEYGDSSSKKKGLMKHFSQPSYSGDGDNSSKKTGLQKVVLDLTEELDGFDLAPNSIAFVALEPYFRIPEYMALRFNLKIKHIYKGLLLGTGPLVDPGFRGNLFIPLHNLTCNTYHFKYGDTLITMEFTKLSRNQRWNNMSENILPHTEDYKEEKIPEQRDVKEYLSNALKNDRLDSVFSSIPDALREGKIQVKEARKEATRIRNWSVGTSVASFIAIAGLIISTINFTMSGYNRVNELIKEYNDKIVTYEMGISELKKEIEELHSELSELKDDVSQISDDGR